MFERGQPTVPLHKAKDSEYAIIAWNLAREYHLYSAKFTVGFIVRVVETMCKNDPLNNTNRCVIYIR